MKVTNIKNRTNKQVFGQKYAIITNTLNQEELSFLTSTLKSVGETDIEARAMIPHIGRIFVSTGENTRNIKSEFALGKKTTEIFQNAVEITKEKFDKLKTNVQLTNNVFKKNEAMKAIKETLGLNK